MDSKSLMEEVKIRYVVFLNSINYHILNFILNRLIKYLDYI